jgi:hypothetical protein
MIGNKAPGNEAETSGTRKSNYYFFRPRNDILYIYILTESNTDGWKTEILNRHEGYCQIKCRPVSKNNIRADRN